VKKITSPAYLHVIVNSCDDFISSSYQHVDFQLSEIIPNPPTNIKSDYTVWSIMSDKIHIKSHHSTFYLRTNDIILDEPLVIRACQTRSDHHDIIY
jgi:hypothetical protein